MNTTPPATLFDPPSDDVLYDALLARDPSYDGFVFVGVSSTGIFCRLTCPARKPKRENTTFYRSVSDCMEAGYRPCKRCKPMSRTGEMAPMIEDLVKALGAEPDRRWSERDLVERGYDPSTVRRTFKREFGLTFLEMARLRRVSRAAENIASGRSVIDAQLDAGFESDSGFREAFTRLLGHAPSEAGSSADLRADWLRTPIGPILAIADRDAVRLLEFFDRPILSRQLTKLQRQAGTGIAFGRHAPIDQIALELDAYFEGRSDRFDTALAPAGTDFERAAWSALRDIPTASTRSYSQQAAAIGKPSAVRAIARANGANPIAIVIPCHRVIGADGSMTGYGGGIWRKTWLLEHENRAFNRKTDHRD